MTTPAELIQMSLKTAGVLGVGQSALAEDTNDAFKILNWMVAEWRTQRWIIYVLEDLSKTSTGAQSYTVGPAGDFNITVRPPVIESAYVRLLSAQPNPVDYPLAPIYSREQYSMIALKNLSSWPNYYFYETAYPLGNFFPWPIPTATQYQLHIVVRKALDEFTSLGQTIVLPHEYESAIHWNLTKRLLAQYRMPPDVQITMQAKDSLQKIKSANLQLPELQIPGALWGNGSYNIYSDTFGRP